MGPYPLPQTPSPNPIHKKGDPLGHPFFYGASPLACSGCTRGVPGCARAALMMGRAHPTCCRFTILSRRPQTENRKPFWWGGGPGQGQAPGRTWRQRYLAGPTPVRYPGGGLGPQLPGRGPERTGQRKHLAAGDGGVVGGVRGLADSAFF